MLARWSKSRTPEPRKTAAMSTLISSRRPAFSNCWMVSGGDAVGKYECWSPSVVSAPAVGNVEGASTGEHGTKFGPETAKVLGARPGHLERHGVRPSGAEFDDVENTVSQRRPEEREPASRTNDGEHAEPARQES